MGGKVGGKLFKTGDMPLHNDNSEEEKAPQAPLAMPLAASGETESAPKQQHDAGLVPATPSLKKRLLGKIAWGGRSEHGKPVISAPMMDENTIIQDETDGDGTDSASDTEEETGLHDGDPFEGLSTELVVTAKDMRPNRPVISRRTQTRNRRSSDLEPRRSERKSSATGRRKPRRSKSDDFCHRKHYESDGSSSVGGGGGDHHKSKRRNRDPLGERVSEAESINSTEFDQQ